MGTVVEKKDSKESLRTLPGDDVRQIMWRYADRYDLQMVVQSSRAVARGMVAHLVADGARKSHEWTEQKATLLDAFDASGITSVFMEPEEGGYIEGPKNLALALLGLELAWVDAGAATASLANNLALAPIHERGTPEQKFNYFSRCTPPQPGEDRITLRGAFILTEPIPYVGADAAMLGGRIRIAAWKEGEEPILQVEKRGRFITNMGFANFATVAVDTDDPRLKTSCMVIVEETDPGTFDRGAPTTKLVHQLSSTRDPIISVKVPANRIIGGYTIRDGAIYPNFTHGEVIDAVFKRTRVTVGLMTSAKLLSAIEPVIRYHRQRYRGGKDVEPGSPRYELGLQLKEDALQRLLDIWVTGEAGCSLGFETARQFDVLEPLEKVKDKMFAERDIRGTRAQLKEFKRIEKDALDYLELHNTLESRRDNKRYQELQDDQLVQFAILNSITNVICPATKLWNTGYGATMMREALSLMGGYGITEDCPGFLPLKWMDAQLEATYEGPEAVQRRQLTITMTNPLFVKQMQIWLLEMREIAQCRPGTGACALATAMQMWLWTLQHLIESKDANGQALYHGNRQGVTFPMSDALCWLLATRYLILDVLELEEKGPENPVLAEGLPGLINFYTDLCHVQTARAAGEVSRVCAELVYGYLRHPSWDDPDNSCCQAEVVDTLEGVMPGVSSGARSSGDVIEENGYHPTKAGPCVRFEGLTTFTHLRTKLDGCLTGARLAKDRAANALTQVMIPEALDYPI
jgi:alkylation response protein AidB-like acyl-CoA dehydrogenase